jgi:hypothetical protein
LDRKGAFALFAKYNQNDKVKDGMRRTRSTNWEMNSYRILAGKPEGKRPLGRLRHRWLDNIKTDLREIGWDGINSIDLAQDIDRGLL